MAADPSKQLNEDIRTLKAYYLDQEQQVKQAVEAWNDQLRELHQEVNRTFEERESALRDNLKLRTESRILMGTLVDIQRLIDKQHEKLERAKTLYLKTTNEYRTEILVLKEEQSRLLQ